MQKDTIDCDGFVEFVFRGMDKVSSEIKEYPVILDVAATAFVLDTLRDECGEDQVKMFHAIRDYIQSYGGPPPEQLSLTMVINFRRRVEELTCEIAKKNFPDMEAPVGEQPPSEITS